MIKMCGSSSPPPSPATPPPAAGPAPVTVVEGPAGSLNRAAAGATPGTATGAGTLGAPLGTTQAKTLLGA